MIKLPNGYVITADSACYALGKITETTSKKTGEKEESISNISYHSTVEGALKSLVAREQRGVVNCKDMSLSDALREFKGVTGHFEQALAEAFSVESKD